MFRLQYFFRCLKRRFLFSKTTTPPRLPKGILAYWENCTPKLLRRRTNSTAAYTPRGGGGVPGKTLRIPFGKIGEPWGRKSGNHHPGPCHDSMFCPSFFWLELPPLPRMLARHHQGSLHLPLVACWGGVDLKNPWIQGGQFLGGIERAECAP